MDDLTRSHSAKSIPIATERFMPAKREIEWCADNVPAIPVRSMTKMPQCMPDEFKEECSVSAYRHFYNVDKRRSFKCVWTDREEPHWWKEHTCLGV